MNLKQEREIPLLLVLFAVAYYMFYNIEQMPRELSILTSLVILALVIYLCNGTKK